MPVAELLPQAAPARVPPSVPDADAGCLRRFRLDYINKRMRYFAAPNIEAARVEAFTILGIPEKAYSDSHVKAFRDAGGLKIVALPDHPIYPPQLH